MNYKKYISSVGLTVGGKSFDGPSQIPKADYLGGNILKFGITSLITIAIVASLLFLIWGGIQWTMSGGDKGGVEAARNKIIYAIVGLVLTLLSFFIVTVIGQMFGVTLIGI